MKQRAITGVLFVLVLVSSLLVGQWSFALFFALVSLLSLNEFYKIITKDEIKPNRPAGLLIGLALFVLIITYQLDLIQIKQFLYIVPLFILVFWWELYRKSEKPFINIAYTLFGVLYTVLPFAFFFNFGFLDGHYNYHYPLGFLILLWSSDTGAYLSGMTLGKTKLFERHSPKKTWEGFIGGLVLSMLSALVLSQYFQGLSTWQWMASSVIIVVFGTFGDLSESMLKRSYQIKDSGTILPGHGGLLDRFDGLLLAAPLVYAFLVLVM